MAYDERMTRKARLSATVDTDLVAAARRAVDEGRFNNVSGWINEALRHQAHRDERLRALAEFITAYEAEHGEITEDEMVAARRRLRERAIVVRGARGAA
jgi:Arc/MetJ-type ribon-helix-helix transcriptional regulator